MDIHLYSKDRVRIKTYDGPFLDIEHVGYESLSVSLNPPHQGYTEIRSKQGHLKLFQFIKKSHKMECDFGWWDDAAVVFSYNFNGKNRTIERE